MLHIPHDNLLEYKQISLDLELISRKSKDVFSLISRKSKDVFGLISRKSKDKRPENADNASPILAEAVEAVTPEAGVSGFGG